MYFEINVSKDGQHVFATAKRSCTNVYDFQKVLKIISEKFTKEEGYEISATEWQEIGQPVKVEFVLEAIK